MGKKKQRGNFNEIEERKFATGHWTPRETELYVKYLVRYLGRTNSSKLRKSRKIFKTMSESVGTRSPNQCRSHHQKQLEKYGTPE